MTRTARLAEGMLSRAKVADWVQEQRRKKWRWAGHVARRTDLRWAYRMLGWEPSWGERSVGRPAIRWEDRLEGFARSVGKNWRTVAMDRNQWQQMEQQFVEFEG